MAYPEISGTIEEVIVVMIITLFSILVFNFLYSFAPIKLKKENYGSKSKGKKKKN